MNLHQKYKTATFVCLAFTAISFCLIFLIPFVVEREAYSSILDQATLRTENYLDWGKYPGNHNVGIQKEYSLFTIQLLNKTNDTTTLFLNESKKFPYSMNLTYENPEYVPNTKEQIKYTKKFELDNKFDENELKNLTITHPNIGVYQAFQRESTLRDEQIIVYDIYKMINTLKDNFDSYYYAHSVFYFYIANNSLTLTTIFFKDNLLNNTQAFSMWGDKDYGWMKPKSLAFWMEIITSELFEKHPNWNILKSYFGLSDSQIELLVGKSSKLYELFYILQGIVLEKFQATKDLYKLQWTTQISNKPLLKEIPPFVSLQNYNSTLPCYPEIGFLSTIKYDFDTLIYSPGAGVIDNSRPSLLNFETVKLILENENNINFIKATFNFYTEAEAINLMKYVQYVKFNCSMRYNVFPKANKELIAINNLIDPVIKNPLNDIEDFLLVNLTNKAIANVLKNKTILCSDIFNNDILKNMTVLCSNENFNMVNAKSNYFWIKAFLNGNLSLDFNLVLNITNMTSDQLSFLLFNSSSTYSKYLQIIQTNFSMSYQCTHNPCSSHELAIKQWTSSYVTLNLPSTIFDKSEITNTIRTWNLEYFGEKIPEIYAVLLTIYNISSFNLDVNTADNLFSYKEGNLLNSFDRLLFINLVESGDLSVEILESKFNLDLSTANLIYDYFKYIIVEYLFDGMFVTKTAYELFYGYDNKYIKRINSLPALLGGDPINLNISLIKKNNNNLNEMVGNSEYSRLDTGLDDEDNSRKIRFFNGNRTIMKKKQYTNGLGIISYYENPWTPKNSIVEGTDGFGFKPLIDKSDSIQIFDDKLYRNIKLEYQTTEKCYQYSCLKYGISDSELEISDFYNTETKGIFNMSSFSEFPIEASHPYFYKVDKALFKDIKINNKNVEDYASDANNELTFYLIEEKTGVTAGRNDAFQFNLHMKRNRLLNSKIIPLELHVPLFMESTNMRFNEERAIYQFDEINLKFHRASIIRWVMVALCCVFFLIFLVLCYKYCKGKNTKRNSVDSLIPEKQEV